MHIKLNKTYSINKFKFSLTTMNNGVLCTADDLNFLSQKAAGF